jgi:hypothetical protein
MRKLPTYLFVLLIIASFTTCKRDSSGPCGGRKSYYNLSDIDKAKVPYTGTDTLVFVSNTNDTAICIGQGKKQFYEKVARIVSMGDCASDTDFYEAYNYKFSTNNFKIILDFNLYKDDLYGLETVHITKNLFTEFRIYLVDINNKSVANFIDSIQVRDKWFKNVTFTNKYFDSNLDKLYYNNEYGILKMQNSDSTEVWELLTKK